MWPGPGRQPTCPGWGSHCFVAVVVAAVAAVAVAAAAAAVARRAPAAGRGTRSFSRTVGLGQGSLGQRRGHRFGERRAGGLGGSERDVVGSVGWGGWQKAKEQGRGPIPV